LSGKVFLAKKAVGGINQIAETVQKKLKHCRYGSIGALSCQISLNRIGKSRVESCDA